MWLSWAFKQLMPVVHAMWEAKWKEVSITVRGCWVVNNSAGVPLLAQALNRQILKSERANVVLRTFDFSDMYTNIELSSLKSQVGKLRDWIFAHQKKVNSKFSVVTVSRSADASATWSQCSVTDNSKQNPTFWVV